MGGVIVAWKLELQPVRRRFRASLYIGKIFPPLNHRMFRDGHDGQLKLAGNLEELVWKRNINVIAA